MRLETRSSIDASPLVGAVMTRGLARFISFFTRGLSVAAWLAPLVACSPSAADAPPSAMGRIVTLRGPDTPQNGRAAGCLSYGANVGSGLGNLLFLTGAIDQPVVRDERGKIQVIALALASGLDRLDAADPSHSSFDLALVRGEEQDDGRFIVATSPMRQGDGREWGGRLQAELAIDDWIETRPTSILIPVPIFADFVGTLELERAQLRGKLDRASVGLGVSQAVLSGYVPREAFLSLLERMMKLCGGRHPPEICGIIPSDATTPEAVLPLLVQLMNGFDARVDDGQPRACTPGAEDCNAVSACLRVDIDPIEGEAGSPAP